MQTQLTLKQRQKINTTNLAKWTLIWLLSLALCSFGPVLIWEHNNVVSGFFIVVNVVVGIAMIIANKRNLQELDELQQKIHLSAMGFTLGAVVVGGLAYSNLQLSGIIDVRADIPDIMFLMGAVYLISTYILNKRYSCDEGDE